MRKELKEIINKFPKDLSVAVAWSKEGGLYAEIEIKEDVLRTQAETLPELIEMVNDAVYTYFEVPREHLPDMPTYIPPIEVAQDLNLYPTQWSRTLIAPINN